MTVRDVYKLKDSMPFNVRQNEEISVNLELRKAPPRHHTLLVGKVVCNGLPVSDATVKVFGCGGRPLAHVMADEAGEYRIENVLKPGEYTTIASSPFCRTSNAETFQVEEHGVTRLDFTLKFNRAALNGIVYGAVFEEDGATPIRRAEVLLAQAGGGMKVEVSTNESGQYILYNIVPGRYVITAGKHGYDPTIPVELVVEAGSFVAYDLKLASVRGGQNGTISGSITHRGKPVPNTVVVLYRLGDKRQETLVQVQTTNRDGEYLFSGVGRGYYAVKSTMQGRQEFIRRVDM